MRPEISGDIPLSITERLQYLLSNVAKNVRGAAPAVRRQAFRSARLARTPGPVSPGRALAEAFLHDRLPALLAPGPVRVMEIGCGSGNLSIILSQAGYSGRYVGVDIGDRFSEVSTPGFSKTFVRADIHQYQPDETFDLVMSVSALEHIPDDARLTRRLDRLVAPGGLQVHLVPSAWGLPVYLWHGYRQYTLASLAVRFEPRDLTVFALGGGASFLLHFVVITIGEMLLGFRLRRRFRRVYRAMLDGCLWLDRFAPVCATTYAVCVRSSSSPAQPR